MKLSALRHAFAAANAGWLGHALGKLDPFLRTSWAQEGEDLVLARLLGQQRNGFYVDVGAHHPFRFSNTAYFYSRGWSGINFEPDPDGYSKLVRYRPRDINVNIGISDKAAELSFFRFSDPALNTLDPDVARLRVERDGYSLIEERAIKVMPLEAALRQHMPAHRKIDFMTVDAEGRDLEVLNGNDWALFSPRIVVAETFGLNLNNVSLNPVCALVLDKGYDFVAKTGNSVFFVRREQR